MKGQSDAGNTAVLCHVRIDAFCVKNMFCSENAFRLENVL